MDYDLLTIIYRISNSCQVNGRTKGRAVMKVFSWRECGDGKV
jgi:hypothetical protein